MSISLARKFFAALAALVASTALVAISPASASSGPTVTITNAGDLIILGTTAEDDVSMSVLGDDLYVSAWSGDSETSRIFDVGELRRDVVINLRGGGGSVVLYQLDIPRDLKINMGLGDNYIHYDQLEVGRNTNVIAGAGPAEVRVFSSTVLGRANFSTGNDDTKFEFRDNRWGGNFGFRVSNRGQFSGSIDGDVFARPARISGGGSADSLKIYGVGEMFESNITVDLRGGDDLLDVDGIVRFARATFRTGSGNDEINIYDAAMTGPYRIDMGAGDDIAFLSSLFAEGRGTVNGGAGSDLLGVVNFHGTPLRVRGVEGGYGY